MQTFLRRMCEETSEHRIMWSIIPYLTEIHLTVAVPGEFVAVVI
jgi:hypothetical protein